LSAAARKYRSCWRVIGSAFRSCSQSRLQLDLSGSDTSCMITFIAIAAPLAALGAIDALAAKFGAETRPGFDERTPIR
jgi:hypothetical protein